METELVRWEEERDRLEEVRTRLVATHGQTGKPARVADKCLRVREERVGRTLIYRISGSSANFGPGRV